MKFAKHLTLVAPLALALAACGGDADTAEADGTLADTTTNDTTMMAPADGDYPQVPVDARANVNYQRTYTNTAADGTTSTIALGADDSYTMTAADGTQSTGTFNWYSDNSRILIRENGETQVYGVADGALYRLSDENADPNGPRDAATTYRASGAMGGGMNGTMGS